LITNSLKPVETSQLELCISAQTMSVSVVHTGKWTTIGEPVLDLKINRAWKSNAQLRREADAAAGQSSDDRYTRAALGHRHTQSEHVSVDTGPASEEQLKTKTAPKQIEHVVPLMQHLKTHRAGLCEFSVFRNMQAERFMLCFVQK
jgi:hypothetical protein